MKEDIRAKLSKEVKAFKSEKDVFYILGEIRKLLEHTNDRRYLTLKFYCNWALHIKIEDVRVVREFFIEVDKDAKQYIAERKTTIRHKMNDYIASFLSLAKLRKELISFFDAHKIIHDLEQETSWNRFRTLLKEILMDVPLIFKDSPKSIPNAKIMSFQITRNDMFGLSKKIPVLAWELYVTKSPIPMTGFIPEE